MSSTVERSKREALWGLFIADALAMPVHWYYNPSDIKCGYAGWLTGYVAPAKHHPSSILTISAIGKCLSLCDRAAMSSAEIALKDMAILFICKE